MMETVDCDGGFVTRDHVRWRHIGTVGRSEWHRPAGIAPLSGSCGTTGVQPGAGRNPGSADPGRAPVTQPAECKVDDRIALLN